MQQNKRKEGRTHRLENGKDCSEREKINGKSREGWEAKSWGMFGGRELQQRRRGLKGRETGRGKRKEE